MNRPIKTVCVLHDEPLDGSPSLFSADLGPESLAPLPPTPLASVELPSTASDGLWLYEDTETETHLTNPYTRHITRAGHQMPLEVGGLYMYMYMCPTVYLFNDAGFFFLTIS